MVNYRLFSPAAYQARFSSARTNKLPIMRSNRLFTVILERLNQLRGPLKFKAWVARIPSNAATAELRRRNRHTSMLWVCNVTPYKSTAAPVRFP